MDFSIVLYSYCWKLSLMDTAKRAARASVVYMEIYFWCSEMSSKELPVTHTAEAKNAMVQVNLVLKARWIVNCVFLRRSRSLVHRATAWEKRGWWGWSRDRWNVLWTYCPSFVGRNVWCRAPVPVHWWLQRRFCSYQRTAGFSAVRRTPHAFGKIFRSLWMYTGSRLTVSSRT